MFGKSALLLHKLIMRGHFVEWKIGLIRDFDKQKKFRIIAVIDYRVTRFSAHTAAGLNNWKNVAQ